MFDLAELMAINYFSSIEKAKQDLDNGVPADEVMIKYSLSYGDIKDFIKETDNNVLV